MAYSGGFVVAVFQDGKQVEESKQGVVAIPFGSEYTIRLRNRSDRDAVAQVFIDGENVSEDGFIIRAGQYSDIERPIKEASKFRFVSAKSSEARDAGKDDQPDDRNGVIEVKWRAEKPRLESIVYTASFGDSPPWKYSDRDEKTGGGIKLPDYTLNSNHVDDGGTAWCGAAPLPDGDNVRSRSIKGKGIMSMKKLEEGCTVEGSRSNQSFRVGYIGELETEAVSIKLILKGYKESNIIARGRFCGGCGKAAEAAHKFCTNCGKRL